LWRSTPISIATGVTEEMAVLAVNRNEELRAGERHTRLKLTLFGIPLSCT